MEPLPRRTFLQQAALAAAMAALSGRTLVAALAAEALDPSVATDWLARWGKSILAEARHRSCDRELGEEIGWLVSPLLNGFYYGYLATRDPKWVGLLADWADSWLKRGTREPDGFIGWPKEGPDGAQVVLTDSLLGEAMGFRPVVLMAAEILREPSLQAPFGARARAWLELAGQVFEKWDSRGCWRDLKEGGLWVVPPFGLDPQTGRWTEGYARRASGGFSNPANKQNLIAQWLLALHDATGQPGYRDRAQAWFRQMRARMRTRDGGKYFVWNYWDPAGPWDYNPDGSTRHWVGVHPNGGYYGIDVEGMVAAYEHKLVIARDDLERLIATNRDFMWNQRLEGAKFQRIDGEAADARWKDSPGVLWTSLVPYDATLREILIKTLNPEGWGGLALAPWFLERDRSPKT